MALKEAVRREASVEIVMEEAPVGDHQANGVAETAEERAGPVPTVERCVGE